MIQRLNQGKAPTTTLDEASLIHDIDYMNPYITKEQADNNMVNNLRATNENLIALGVKTVLKIGNMLGSKVGSLKSYWNARNKAISKGYINPKMSFTPFTTKK